MANPDQDRDPETGRWIKSGNGAVSYGVAATLVASALAGGGLSGAASAGGSVTELGIPRTATSRTATRGQSQTRTSITNIADDTVRATVRLERAGRFKTTVDLSQDGSACAAHSYGEVHQFFTTHECRLLYRGLVDARDKNYVILISIATVYMPDYPSATQLHRLLLDPESGGITALSQERGRYRHIAFTHAPTWWSRQDTTLTIVQGQPVGRAPAAAVIQGLIIFFLDNLS
jgi:hypothetical protein